MMYRDSPLESKAEEAVYMGTYYGMETMVKYMKDNPNITMPPMPMNMFIRLTKAGVEFDVVND